MTELQFSKKSLFWRLASVYGPMENWSTTEQTNICEYTTAVLRGLGVVLFIILAFSAGLFPVADLIAWIFACAEYGLMMPGPGIILGFGFYVIVGNIVGICWLKDNRDAKLRELRALRKEGKIPEPSPVEPNFIVEAWIAFKEKTCVRVKIS